MSYLPGLILLILAIILATVWAPFFLLIILAGVAVLIGDRSKERASELELARDIFKKYKGEPVLFNTYSPNPKILIPVDYIIELDEKARRYRLRNDRSFSFSCVPKHPLASAAAMDYYIRWVRAHPEEPDPLGMR